MTCSRCGTRLLPAGVDEHGALLACPNPLCGDVEPLVPEGDGLVSAPDRALIKKGTRLYSAIQQINGTELMRPLGEFIPDDGNKPRWIEVTGALKAVMRACALDAIDAELGAQGWERRELSDKEVLYTFGKEVDKSSEDAGHFGPDL